MLLTVCAAIPASAQQFFHLTADELRVDTLSAPQFTHVMPLPEAWRDSVYTVRIVYPEYADMAAADVANYKRLVAEQPDAEPKVETHVTFDCKRASLLAAVNPVVFRDGRYKQLVSFMLRRESRAKFDARRDAAAYGERADAKVNVWDTLPAAKRYAEHSVLREGRWAKIRVAESGIYQLTSALVRQAGFTDINKVKLYGYGGNLINETLDPKDLVEHDDLKEVATCDVDGKRLFYARGPVSWETETADRRTRNYYSNYGYYFLTEDTSSEPAKVDYDTFVASFYPSPDFYHDIHEQDAFSWYKGGRNFFGAQQVSQGSYMTVDIHENSNATNGNLYVVVTSSNYCKVLVEYNDSVVGTLQTSNSDSQFIYGCESCGTYRVPAVKGTAKVKLSVLSGSNPMRLDMVSMAWDKPRPLPDLKAASFPTPTYVYNIMNQDHHADPQADLVIIIPTSQKLLKQAQRLKAFHEQHDSLKVNLVPADELFNEFSSGTPDASAYRRYMKMLYDRSTGEDDRPKYLLLFGDCLWDNRMITSYNTGKNPDDYLLAFESENSYDRRVCYIDDSFHAMLDDGEGLRPMYVDKLDIGVGRFPVLSDAEAKIMVDKTINYAENGNGGAWQNTIMFMGDDGDYNIHMTDANLVAEKVSAAHPQYVVKKVMWDAYQMQSGATGNTYPEVTNVIKKQQQQGALIMDYAGHGSEILISHEKVLGISDFAAFSNKNMPLWVTASCDIMPFDNGEETIGETALLNDKGGTMAFYGTSRTVYASHNTTLNSAFMKHVLTYEADGKPIALGEAVRRAKNDMNGQTVAENSLQYSLLGDPALRLHLPTAQIVIDSINGVDITKAGATVAMKAGSLATVKGHIADNADFNGTVSLTVRDNLETITCRLNQPKEAENPFEYTDRTKTIFSGDDRISGGRFSVSFAVPKDINYSDQSGLINAFAINDDHTLTAHGYTDKFIVGGSDIAQNDSVGPSIYCYLNSPSFSNGDRVNSTPYFVAEVKDKDGINASGAGIGHDMQLIIDGKMEMTYSLNENFQYDFGSYTSGSTYYNIPQLEEGPHKLQFRAWDILNNYSTAELTFNVVTGQKPSFSIGCTNNPARESTTFIISHDRSGAELGVIIDVFDVSGRLLWRHEESGVSDTGTYTVPWDLTIDGGSRLQTGVYLYRVHLTSEGATRISKAKKLIVVGNN